jgi:hypothetical protein
MRNERGGEGYTEKKSPSLLGEGDTVVLDSRLCGNDSGIRAYRISLLSPF